MRSRTTSLRPAPAAGRLERDGFALRRDEHGNALGGLRLPFIDVPVATYRGEFSEGGGGNTRAFDRETLEKLYPSHDDYVAEMRIATDNAIASGFMLAADRDEWMGRVVATPIRR